MVIRDDCNKARHEGLLYLGRGVSESPTGRPKDYDGVRR